MFKLTETGREAAAHVNRRASRAVKIAGKDLDEATRNIFHEALDSIVRNLRVLGREEIPE